MKSTLLLLMAVLATALAASAAEPFVPRPELAGMGTLYVPADDDTYDTGAGLEGQARVWFNPYIGGAFAAGFVSYVFDDQDIQTRHPDLACDSRLDGDLFAMPIGFSLLLRPVLTDRFSLTLEGGVRYVFVESFVDLEGGQGPSRYPYDYYYYYDYVDIENGVVAVALAQFEVKFGEMASLIAGAGYQFDLEKGDIEWYGEDIGENELAALMIQAGMVIRF